MMQACIDQPVNLQANMKSINRRMPNLSGPSLVSNKMIANCQMYEDFMRTDDTLDEKELSTLPMDLQREVIRGLRTLGGAKRAMKSDLQCKDCGQWRSSKRMLEIHPCPWKLVLPYCPRPRSEPNFPFLPTPKSKDDEYQGNIVQIMTDFFVPEGAWESAEILDAYEDGTMDLRWLKSGTLARKRGVNSKFSGKWQNATGKMGAILWKWLGLRSELKP